MKLMGIVKYVLMFSLINLLVACQMPSSQRSSSSGMPPSSPSGSSGGIPGSPSTPGRPSGSQSKTGSQSGGPSGSSPGGGAQAGSPGSGMPNPSTSTSGKSSSQGGEGDSGDSLENLEQSLDESLGDFDDMILQESAAGSVGDQGVDIFDPISESDSSDGPLFKESPLSEGEMADGQTSANSGSNSASSASDAVGNAGGGAASSDIQEAELPADIDDGRGDDIVARQIREAAMAERNPALRDKLWEEYRKYESQ